MQAVNRWLNWQPENASHHVPAIEITDITDRTTQPGPSAPCSVSSVSLSVPTPEQSMEVQDHTFWSDDFGKWALSECLFSDRGFGGIRVLHLHFCDWCSAQGTVGCMLETFEALLDSEAFLMAGGLVEGWCSGKTEEGKRLPNFTDGAMSIPRR